MQPKASVWWPKWPANWWARWFGPFDLDSAPWTQEVPWFRNRDTAHMHPGGGPPSLGPRRGPAPGGRQRALGPRTGLRLHGAGHGRPRRRDCGAVPSHGLCRRRPGAVGRQDLHQRHHAKAAAPLAFARAPATQARYHLWATRALAVHVDMLPRGRLLARPGPALQEHPWHAQPPAVGRDRVWFPRFAQGVSPSLALDQELESDRAQLARRLVAAAQPGLAPLDGWSDEHLLGTLDYQRMDGQAVSLPFASSRWRMSSTTAPTTGARSALR